MHRIDVVAFMSSIGAQDQEIERLQRQCSDSLPAEVLQKVFIPAPTQSADSRFLWKHLMRFSGSYRSIPSLLTDV